MEMYRVRSEIDLIELVKQSDNGDSSGLFTAVRKYGKEPKIDDCVLEFLRQRDLNVDNVQYTVRAHPYKRNSSYHDRLDMPSDA